MASTNGQKYLKKKKNRLFSGHLGAAHKSMKKA